MNPNDLFSGIWNLYEPETKPAFYTATGGRLYLKQAPQLATFPYAVFSLVGIAHDWTFDATLEEVEGQFNIYSQSKNAQEAGTILAACLSLYDHCDLTVSGWNHCYMQRTAVFELNELEDDPPIFGYGVQFNILLES